MENIVLEFDKRVISKEEILEHIEYYYTKSNEAMELHSLGKIKESREIFKDLRSKLQIEYKYYNKASVSKYIDENYMYINYATGIRDSYVNHNNPNSNETLYNNLYDIQDYISYCKEIILHNKNI